MQLKWCVSGGCDHVWSDGLDVVCSDRLSRTAVDRADRASAQIHQSSHYRPQHPGKLHLGQIDAFSVLVVSKISNRSLGPRWK